MTYCKTEKLQNRQFIVPAQDEHS